MVVEGPVVQVSSPEDFRLITGRELGYVGKTFLGLNGVEVLAPQHIGLLNVTGAASPELRLKYRSKTGGKSFEIVFDGRKLTIDGASHEEVGQALDLIFTKEGEINLGEKGIHVNTIRNLDRYDEEGNPR